jgi:hypothetical protein
MVEGNERSKVTESNLGDLFPEPCPKLLGHNVILEGELCVVFPSSPVLSVQQPLKILLCEAGSGQPAFSTGSGLGRLSVVMLCCVQ